MQKKKKKKKRKISSSLIEFFLLPIIYSFLLSFLFLIIVFHFTFQSYTSILYLRLPPSFRMILHGKDVEHHNIENDMMMSQEVTYRPHPSGDGVPKDTNVTHKIIILIQYSVCFSTKTLILCNYCHQMIAVVTIGFVKDAKYHIDVQGFNVYHKNRLIKV